MNREIKFRGKSIKDNRWVYGFYVQTKYLDDDLGEVVSHWIFDGFNLEKPTLVLGSTVGQYIGLSDKYNKEIYENDYVRSHYDMGTYTHQAVGYAQGMFYPLVKVEYGYNAIDRYRPEEFEVIGNKTDNPELEDRRTEG